MAGLRWSRVVENVAPSVTGPITFLQIQAPANQKVLITRISISGQGSNSGDIPVTFEVLPQTTAGTATHTGVLPNKLNDCDTETVQTTTSDTFTAEPTAGAVKLARNIHPQSNYDFIPLGQPLTIKGGTSLGIRALQASQTTKFTVLVEGEE